jgi:hypothetical protein
MDWYKQHISCIMSLGTPPIMLRPGTSDFLQCKSVVLQDTIKGHLYMFHYSCVYKF